MANKTILFLTLLSTLAFGNTFEAIEKRSLLEGRAECLAGATTCSVSGIIRYCANPGNKCCDARNSAPISATCCPNGLYAPVGYYCCSSGRSCPNGRSCTGCTPVDGTGGFVGSSVAPAIPSLTLTPPPSAPSATRIVGEVRYYTFTITYYYWQYYWVYVPALTRSTTTSSTVTTTTTVSVFASNSADASSSFDALSATISLPTPARATSLPSIPSQTAAGTTTSRRPENSSVVSPSPSQFAGGQGRVAGENSWVPVMIGVVVGMLGLGANLVL